MTDKLDPMDIDLAIRSDLWDDTLFAAALSASYPSEVALVDFYCNPKRSTQHMEDLFRETRIASVQKGIIELIP